MNSLCMCVRVCLCVCACVRACVRARDLFGLTYDEMCILFLMHFSRQTLYVVLYIYKSSLS